MYFHVFNKKPSRKGIEQAMLSSDVEEQAQTLAMETAPVKGEIWQNENGRLLVIRSNHIFIQGAESENFVECYGVVVADLLPNSQELDFDIFMRLDKLLKYKKVGFWKLKLKGV